MKQLSIGILALGLAAFGCSDDGTPDVSAAGDAMKEAASEVSDAMEDAGKAVEDAAEDAADAMEDAAE